MYRNTYVEVNLNNLKDNVKNLIKKYRDYKYYFGVVKADCYGHGIETVKTIIYAGCNYLNIQQQSYVQLVPDAVPLGYECPYNVLLWNMKM